MNIKKYTHLYCESGVVPISNNMDDFFIMSRKVTTDSFIESAKMIHRNKYDYSKVNYVSAQTKICIICPKYGEFWQTPNSHLNGKGCPMCSRNKKMDTNEFIRRVREVYGDKYDYSKVKYKNARTKVCIICPEHGEFWQLPGCHLIGQGCPKCTSSILENTMRLKLQRLGIEFKEQKTFDWLKYKSYMFLDFYLPQYNIAIECQGIQHFEPVDAFGGIKEFKECKYRDKLKKDLCNKYNVNLLYFNYNDDIDEFEQKLKEYGIY